MNKWIIFSLFLTVSFSARAQTPTIIFAADKNNAFLLEQPENSENPLGNPIVSAPLPQTEQPFSSAPDQSSSKSQKNSAPAQIPGEITEYESINPEISPQTTPQIEAGKIQNTIFQGGERIYDVQSIPIKDINTVEEPNIQPTISTYPAY